MEIAIIANDTKKELMTEFCIAYCGILSKHNLCATSITAKYISEEKEVADTKQAIQGAMDIIAEKISDEADYENPYFAPLRHTDFSGLPETLILTMEFDPLRDEGEALARRLKEGGTDVTVRRIRNGIHGMLSLPPATPITRQLYKHIIEFLPGVIHAERNETKLP